jgi:hypothetical protein
MALENKQKSVPATLGLMLLSLGMASPIVISAPNDVSAQGSLEGLGTEQGSQGGSRAQQADTGVATLNGTTIGQASGGGVEPTACTPIQTGGGGQNATTTGGGGNAATDMNTTSTTAEGGGNQSTSMVRDFIEEACIALQVGDTQGALMQLNSALGELGGGGGTQGNTTTSGGEGTFDEGVSVGGTSASDDYDATADAEAG